MAGYDGDGGIHGDPRRLSGLLRPSLESASSMRRSTDRYTQPHAVHPPAGYARGCTPPQPPHFPRTS